MKPPILKEKGVINAFNQQSRRPGYNPYEDPEAGLKALEESFSIYSMLEGKLRRTQEQQVAQIFSTGKLTMNDEKGNAAYDLDFLAKVEQMATVGTTWAVDGTTGSPLADISALAAKVRTNAQINRNVLVFGNSAWARFSSNALVKSQLDNRNMMIGSIAPEDRGEGATFQGRIWIGQYQFEAWTYDAFYQDPITGAEVPFINTEHMLMISEKARLDMTFGGIPRIAEMDPRFTHFIPERISSVSRNLDLNPYAYVSPDGASLSIEVGTRPLPVPTAIDSFARLKVTA